MIFSVETIKNENKLHEDDSSSLYEYEISSFNNILNSIFENYKQFSIDISTYFGEACLLENKVDGSDVINAMIDRFNDTLNDIKKDILTYNKHRYTILMIQSHKSAIFKFDESIYFRKFTRFKNLDDMLYFRLRDAINNEYYNLINNLNGIKTSKTNTELMSTMDRILYLLDIDKSFKSNIMADAINSGKRIKEDEFYSEAFYFYRSNPLLDDGNKSLNGTNVDPSDIKDSYEHFANILKDTRMAQRDIDKANACMKDIKKDITSIKINKYLPSHIELTSEINYMYHNIVTAIFKRIQFICNTYSTMYLIKANACTDRYEISCELLEEVCRIIDERE